MVVIIFLVINHNITYNRYNDTIINIIILMQTVEFAYFVTLKLIMIFNDMNVYYVTRKKNVFT